MTVAVIFKVERFHLATIKLQWRKNLSILRFEYLITVNLIDKKAKKLAILFFKAISKGLEKQND
jgi:hypothetical protein